MQISKTEQLVQPHRVLLTEEEESSLFAQFKATRDSQDPKEVRTNKRVLDRIIMNFTPVVRKIARELSGYKVPTDELISEGLLGLVDAAHRFDLGMGNRFSAYAQAWVRGVMFAYITKNYFPVNVCTNQVKKKMFFHMRRIISDELRRTGTSEVSAELIAQLAEKFGVEEKEIHAMNALFRNRMSSLSDEVGDSEMTQEDLLADPTNPHEIVEQVDQVRFHQHLISLAVDTLRPREKEIFLEQILHDDPTTLEMLGKRFDISKERVRQIRNMAFDKVSKEICRLMEETDTSLETLF